MGALGIRTGAPGRCYTIYNDRLSNPRISSASALQAPSRSLDFRDSMTSSWRHVEMEGEESRLVSQKYCA